jgi:hypothetical protein
MKKNDFNEMLQRATPITMYMRECSAECQPKYEARRTSYTPRLDILNAIKSYANGYIVVAIGADWCKDCVSNLPVLDLIHEATGLPVYVLSGVKTDPLNPNRQWAVPPSPPEVDTLGIKAIPTILLYTPAGQEIGRIIENPSMKPTLEEELLCLIEAQ